MDGTGESVSTVTPKTPETNSAPSHKRLVFADPAAFRYLEEDPSTEVLERHRRLGGYELYYVEQWICSRVHPTFLIATYTGLEQQSIIVGVLNVPTDEDKWSTRLRVYLKALRQFHAREKDTPLGTLMITNLSSFPSALTVIPIPDGDARKHREDFFVNENLKRMDCAGRAGMNLSPPVPATQSKFMQLYRTSDRVPLKNAVLELVKLCQVALVLFGKLEPEYCDGLLCDVTEKAINDWWDDMGYLLFHVDPTDGILGPSTVAAILGILMGARNRLHAFGAPVAKDVFDLVATKRAIAHFQKVQKIEPRSRRLDHNTLDKLHRATAKAASGEGWTMHRAVKSTVAELSGKGSDMVRDMVGREKIGIADIETLDIETFVELLTGERSKWLWYGKPRKNAQNDAYNHISDEKGQLFTQNDEGDFVWTSPKRESVVDDHRLLGLPTRIYSQSLRGSQADLESMEPKDTRRRNVIGRVTGKVKGAVGIRGHQQKLSRAENTVADNDSSHVTSNRNSLDRESQEVTPSSSAFGMDSSKSPALTRQPSALPEKVKILRRQYDGVNLASKNVADSDGQESLDSDAVRSPIEEPPTASVSGDEAFDVRQLDPPDSSHGLYEAKATKFMRDKHVPLSLQRSQSCPTISAQDFKEHYTYRWPRCLSFDLAWEALSGSYKADGLDYGAYGLNQEGSEDPEMALADEKTLALDARLMFEGLRHLKSRIVPCIEAQIKELAKLDDQATRDQEYVDELYNQKLEEHNELHNASNDLISEERIHMTEALKDLETLGSKFEYELNSLQSKVEDMENGIAEFERQVLHLEARAEEIKEGPTDSWYRWFLGILTRWVQGKK